MKDTVPTIEEILEKAVQGERLDTNDALALFQSSRINEIGAAAYRVRQRLHPESYVTYVVDRNINYTNVCVSQCKFCAFYRNIHSDEAYVITREELREKICETQILGGRQILMQGGLHPELRIDFYEDLLCFIKTCFPNFHIHGFSPPEIVHFSRLNSLSVEKVIRRLSDAGLDSIPGGGAEILCDVVRRQISPNKCTSDEWIDVMHTSHTLGLRSSATMMFGHIETLPERVKHLQRIRNLQDETGGFTAFIPWTFQPENTQIERDPVGGFEYLKTLAIARLYLDNIQNIQASWVTQGAKIGQVALCFGANDLGSTMIEENVVRAAGVHYRISIEEIERLIRDAGFTVKRRDFLYNLV